MIKPKYEGYCECQPTKLVREQFGNANVYAQNAKSLLTKATGFIGNYDFTLNPYRGCQYGCSYCYAAAFSPNTKMRQDWGKWVIFKENAAEILGKELQKWYKQNPTKPPSIYMSSVTDPYQPLESKYQLTRSLLEVMLDVRIDGYPTPTLVIQTRSPIITRDIDYLQRFQRLRINMSIPTGSESVRKDFEPRSPSIKARLNAVTKIKQSIDPLKGFVPKVSITITPLLPTFPNEEAAFINKLTIADRVVIQDFHKSDHRSLVASTRQEADAIKRKHIWWYGNEQLSYIRFREKLFSHLPGVEIKEGKEGFCYE